MKTQLYTIRSLPDSTLSDNQTVILDIGASSRYWRTSRLLNITLIRRAEICGSGFCETSYSAEEEADEYELLQLLAEELRDVREVITFNGTAFDLPHLHAKYKAYGLTDPLQGLKTRDLFLDYRFLYSFLGLAGRHLRDYDEAMLGYMRAGGFFPDPEETRHDALKTLRILGFDALISLLDGGWTFVSAARVPADAEPADGLSGEEHMLFTLRSEIPFHGMMSVHDQGCHLLFSGDTARISVPLTQGKLRFYHADTENYVYLPSEGYAVHKSVGAYVDREHKEKAVRTNCFHLFICSDKFLSDRKQLDNYISSLLLFLRSR